MFEVKSHVSGKHEGVLTQHIALMFGVKSLISVQIYPDMGGMKFIQRFCPNVFHSIGANGEFILFLWAAGLRVTAFIEVSQLKPVVNPRVCLVESNDTRSLNSLIGQTPFC